jgi:predicted MPP superfamily phosphohydrolase
MRFPRILSRRSFFRLGAAGLLGGVGVGGYTCAVEPYWIEVVRRELPIARLPAALVGKTLVQLSDVHVGWAVEEAYLAHAFELVAALEPDLIVITGDFMTCKGGECVDRALRVMARLRPARLATLAVLGNHDYGEAYRAEAVADRLAAGLGNLGIEVLRNESRRVAGLEVIGLDDFWSPNFDLEGPLEDWDPDSASLVLCHNPDVADEPGWNGYRGWILSGHTHGGQCKPPFLPPPVIPVRNRRYTSGVFDLHDGRSLYINRALGHLAHVRFNVRPEITAFTLARA